MLTLIATGEDQPTADFVYADFNSTHGLTFAGASGTTACANVTELEYGDVQGDADQLRGSLDMMTREAGEEVVTTDVRTSELEEHDRITPNQVRAARCFSTSVCCKSTRRALKEFGQIRELRQPANATIHEHASRTP